ncbi:tRNA pseudouridine(55) synthase TruB [Candidatus Gracilibacteria bacterium HOT-871]|nr:tRNA pseudouridine(55) synthase TruB [Candidatus Gracilibacteria bacterium HOT-871]
MNAFYLIDKPLGMTSFDVIRFMRKKLNIKKIGHTGTLDPLATGGLLVATGNYTKLIPYFEKDKKTYEFDVCFDGTSDSFDLGTEVAYLTEEEKDFYKKNISRQKLENILQENFFGEISQTPPKYSALKINGKKALERVKNGEEFELKSRKCTIFEIKLLDFCYPRAKILATVSAGTYIRSIANDLGKIIGSGAYVTFLRRIKIGKLDLSLAQNLENFDEKIFLNLKEIFQDKNFISLEKSFLEKINNGLSVYGKFYLDAGKDIFVFDSKNITNVVSYDGEKLIPKRKII